MILTDDHFDRWAEYLIDGISGRYSQLRYDMPTDRYPEERLKSVNPDDYRLEEAIEAFCRELNARKPEIITAGRVEYGASPGWHKFDKPETKARFCQCAIRTYYERVQKFKKFASEYVTRVGF